MKPVSSLFGALSLSLLCGICLGQDVPAPLNPQAERLLVSVRRAEQEAIFQRQQEACYQRFAVNECLIQARRERREVLDELRRRDVLLNALERQTRAIDEINRIQSNLSPEKQQQLSDQAEQARIEALARQTRNDEKNAERLNAPLANNQRTLVDPRSTTPSDSVQNERAYADKLAEAQKRKADLERRLRQQGKPAATLPLPD
jgi:hypothetical protein